MPKFNEKTAELRRHKMSTEDGWMDRLLYQQSRVRKKTSTLLDFRAYVR